jgi:hypothetical protein
MDVLQQLAAMGHVTRVAAVSSSACRSPPAASASFPSRCISLFSLPLHQPLLQHVAACAQHLVDHMSSSSFWGDACSRAFKQPREARLGAIDGSCGVTVSCAAAVVSSRASRAPTDHVTAGSGALFDRPRKRPDALAVEDAGGGGSSARVAAVRVVLRTGVVRQLLWGSGMDSMDAVPPAATRRSQPQPQPAAA